MTADRRLQSESFPSDHRRIFSLSVELAQRNQQISEITRNVACKKNIARLRLKDIDDEILQLEQSLSLLRMEKQSIQTRLDDLKYPVLTLPNEITSEIFLHFLPPYPKCPPSSGLLSPTLLTHICRKWRQTALFTPALWRAIAIDSDLEPDFRLRKQILASWLVRSCSCPISIKVFEYYDSAGPDIMHALIPHRLRWEYLEVHGGGKRFHIDGLAPILRELNLRLDISPISPISLKEAPLLRTVVLNDEAATNAILPWVQLTSLTLDDVYPKQCTPILLQTCNLVHCQLGLTRHPGHAIEPDVKLQCLESLILIDTYGEVTEYLGTFIVPALRKLEVPEMYLEPDPVSVLTAFISKSGCKLQEVRITGYRSTASALYRKTFPLISNLSFDHARAESDEEEGEDHVDDEDVDE
ncbi:hypothetical protein C8R43DRAFT_1234770 [Mycena crocata]|nr:hypothetical protein C8R43DRAFT_1234770 [Mycena crocata]